MYEQEESNKSQLGTNRKYFWIYCISVLSVEMIEEERGRETKSTWTTRVAFSCLGTPALPCAYCMEQVLSWTQEREERQKWEGRRREAALTDPKSHETMTDWNHRLWNEPLTQQTHPKHWCTLCVSPTESLFLILFKSAGKHPQTMAQCITPVQERYVCLEHLYPSLAPSLSDYIMSHTNSSLSLWLSMLHLGTRHTHCIAFPPGSYVKQLVISGCMWWKHGLQGFFFICTQDPSSQEH